MRKEKVSIFWFRRDLRLADNRALHEALEGVFPVLPVFIFDTEILSDLNKTDSRVSFIYERLETIADTLSQHGSSLFCQKGNPQNVWRVLIEKFDIQAVYANEDYEPYARERDNSVREILAERGIPFYLYKDQVIFAKSDVLKGDGTPYTVFTPYKNKWLQKLREEKLATYPVSSWGKYAKIQLRFPEMSALGIEKSATGVVYYSLAQLERYEATRNFPAENQTSRLGPHLRFGTVSIREVLAQSLAHPVFLSELIWREFFMQVLYHFPYVVAGNFKKKYNQIVWRNNLEEFQQWKQGQTGYALVDAGMRELNETGYMHNRVRMVVASFLCKHLLIDWRWGEAYFAEKLLDFELASNNGNWQWAAGTGCDAAPYFRVFNPIEQLKKFDSDMDYVRKWIPEVDSSAYPSPIVAHKFARERAIAAYKKGLQGN